jgi:hypothetical protein
MFVRNTPSPPRPEPDCAAIGASKGSRRDPHGHAGRPAFTAVGRASLVRAVPCRWHGQAKCAEEIRRQVQPQLRIDFCGARPGHRSCRRGDHRRKFGRGSVEDVPQMPAGLHLSSCLATVVSGSIPSRGARTTLAPYVSRTRRSNGSSLRGQALNAISTSASYRAALEQASSGDCRAGILEDV